MKKVFVLLIILMLLIVGSVTTYFVLTADDRVCITFNDNIESGEQAYELAMNYVKEHNWDVNLVLLTVTFMDKEAIHERRPDSYGFLYVIKEPENRYKYKAINIVVKEKKMVVFGRIAAKSYAKFKSIEEIANVIEVKDVFNIVENYTGVSIDRIIEGYEDNTIVIRVENREDKPNPEFYWNVTINDYYFYINENNNIYSNFR